LISLRFIYCKNIRFIKLSKRLNFIIAVYLVCFD
jgi:hypothetical protein